MGAASILCAVCRIKLMKGGDVRFSLVNKILNRGGGCYLKENR